jgi:DNA mismatch repair protein MutS2
LLAELESREQRLRETEKEAEVIAEDARARARRVAERERAVKERERNSERDARREARRVLLDARDEIERTIRELREAQAEASEEAAREARRRVEQLAADEAGAISALDKAAEADARGQRLRYESTSPAAPPAEGDFVSVPSLGGKTARLIEIRGDDAIVTLGSVKMTVPRATLAHASAPQGGERVQIALHGDIPELEAKTEIDLRGMRAAEIEDLVMRAVDSAIRADLKSLRFIHGKGTGALRDRVAEMLSKESRVTSFRLGAWNEGGAGVTVAELS